MKKVIFVLTVFFLCQNVNSQNGFCLGPFSHSPDTCDSFYHHLGAEDFNSDSKPDIYFESFQGIGILMSSVTGSFSGINSYTMGQAMDVVRSADFNNDGHADIAATNYNAPSVNIMLGTGTGSFNSLNVFQLGSNPYEFTIADFNGDGKMDIATANYSVNTVSVFFGNGIGSFTGTINYTVVANPYSIVSGDLDNNGKLDLLVVSGNGSSVLAGNGLGSFTVMNGPSIDAYRIIAQDINSDTKIDLIYKGNLTSGIKVATGNGNFTFNSPQTYVVNLEGFGFSTGDFNNDGKIDLAGVSYHSVAIFPGTGSGLFAGPIYYQSSVSTQMSWLLAADLNVDGRPDIIAVEDDPPSPGFLNLLYNCNTVDVGIEERSDKNIDVNLFPNPANDFLSFEFSNENNFKTISIYNNLGQLLLEKEISSGHEKISISIGDLAEGVYFVKLKSTTKGTVSKRFVISR